MSSPESAPVPEQSEHYEQTLRICERINIALQKAAELRGSPHDEQLKAELAKLAGSLAKDTFHGSHLFRLVIPHGANARTSRNYADFIDTSPPEFIADSVNRIDIIQADFYNSKRDEAVYLTSFDFNLSAEPMLPESFTATDELPPES